MVADRPSPAFAWVGMNDFDRGMRERHLKTECFKMLLKNDADASMMMDAGDNISVSIFQFELHVCSLVCLASTVGRPVVT